MYPGNTKSKECRRVDADECPMKWFGGSSIGAIWIGISLGRGLLETEGGGE